MSEGDESRRARVQAHGHVPVFGSDPTDRHCLECGVEVPLGVLEDTCRRVAVAHHNYLRDAGGRYGEPYIAVHATRYRDLRAEVEVRYGSAFEPRSVSDGVVASRDVVGRLFGLPIVLDERLHHDEVSFRTEVRA